MDSYVYVINDIPPSNNAYLGQTGTNWKYSKIKKQFALLVKGAIHERPAKPIERCKIRIHYIFPDRRRRDLDNYSGKILIDPLIESGIILDDNHSVVTELTLSAEVRKKERKSIITIQVI